MSRQLPRRGDWKKIEGRWHICMSVPQQWPEGMRHVWRDGCVYTVPEWADPVAEAKAATQPIPALPTPRYVIVRASA